MVLVRREARELDVVAELDESPRVAAFAPLAPRLGATPAVRMAVDDTPALGRRAALFGAATALTLGSPFEASAAYDAAEAAKLREKAQAKAKKEAAAKAALQKAYDRQPKKKTAAKKKPAAKAPKPAATVKQGKAANAKKAKQAAAATKVKAKQNKAKRNAAARRRGGGPLAFLGNIVLLGGAGIAGLALLGDEEA